MFWSHSRLVSLAVASGVTLAFALAPAAPPRQSSSSARDAKFTAEVLPEETTLVVGTAATRNLIVAKAGKSDAVSNGSETVTTNYTATVMQSERAIDRLRIDFGNCPFTTGARAKNQAREQAIARKTFESCRKDGKSVFTGANGANATEADRLAVAPHFLPLIGELPLARVLAGKTLKKGAQLDLTVETANALLSTFRPVPLGGKATLTFVEEKVVDAQECAVFSIAATIPLLGEGQGGSGVTVELTGELTVTKRQCLLLYATCEGTCTFPDAKRDVAADERKPPAKDDAAARKGAFVKETWTYYAKFG